MLANCFAAPLSGPKSRYPSDAGHHIAHDLCVPAERGLVRHDIRRSLNTILRMSNDAETDNHLLHTQCSSIGSSVNRERFSAGAFLA